MTYTHNTNGVCSDSDHNPRGSAPNLLKGNVDKMTFPKRTYNQRRYKNMTTLAQKLETVRAQTEKKIDTVRAQTTKKIDTVQTAADVKIARLTGLLDIEIARVKAIEELDTQTKEDMNAQTETMEA